MFDPSFRLPAIEVSWKLQSMLIYSSPERPRNSRVCPENSLFSAESESEFLSLPLFEEFRGALIFSVDPIVGMTNELLSKFVDDDFSMSASKSMIRLPIPAKANAKTQMS